LDLQEDLQGDHEEDHDLHDHQMAIRSIEAQGLQRSQAREHLQGG